MGSGKHNVIFKVANDNDGYGSGNMCQLPSIEGNESTKVVTHLFRNNKQQKCNMCLRLRSNKSNNNHVLATFKVVKQRKR